MMGATVSTVTGLAVAVNSPTGQPESDSPPPPPATTTAPAAVPPPPPAAKPKKPPRARASKTENNNAHYALVLTAAQTVVEILRTEQIACAVFGSLACRLYGTAQSRCPKDVDLVAFQPPDSESHPMRTAEAIKVLIVSANPRSFYLKLSRDPEATYRILWYRKQYKGPECKVDILLPGTMHLPTIPANRLTWINGVPLVPLALVLLHKLQGWDDHKNATETYKNQKQHSDAADIRRLLSLERMEGLKKTQPWEDAELFDDEFRALSKERVKDYCRAFPDRAEGWQLLGFETS